MHFLIFIPGANTIEALAGVGLAGITDGASVRPDREGPDGLIGGIFHWHATPRRPALFYPRQQTWKAGRGRHFYVGFWDDAPPGPEDLKRSERWSGREIALGDGERWTIPSWRDLSEINPANWELIDGGFRRKPEVDDRISTLRSRAREWERRFQAHEVTNHRTAKVLANEVLALNYRVTREVTEYLGLFRDVDQTLVTCMAHIAGANS